MVMRSRHLSSLWTPGDDRRTTGGVTGKGGNETVYGRANYKLNLPYETETSD